MDPNCIQLAWDTPDSLSGHSQLGTFRNPCPKHNQQLLHSHRHLSVGDNWLLRISPVYCTESNRSLWAGPDFDKCHRRWQKHSIRRPCLRHRHIHLGPKYRDHWSLWPWSEWRSPCPAETCWEPGNLPPQRAMGEAIHGASSAIIGRHRMPRTHAEGGRRKKPFI